MVPFSAFPPPIGSMVPRLERYNGFHLQRLWASSTGVSTARRWPRWRRWLHSCRSYRLRMDSLSYERTGREASTGPLRDIAAGGISLVLHCMRAEHPLCQPADAAAGLVERLRSYAADAANDVYLQIGLLTTMDFPPRSHPDPSSSSSISCSRARSDGGHLTG